MACFFRGFKKEKVMQILESCDFRAEYGLDVLIDKSLVFISEYNCIEMHDLIQDMGKYIVKIQKYPGERSRLWDVEDFKEVMEDNTGTMAVEAIWCTHQVKPCFSKEAMKNMQRLRILCIQTYSWASQSDSEDIVNGSIEYLSNSLCWFVWHDYPWKLLPKNFNPKRLVHIELLNSSLHHLWNDTKQLPYLRRLDLSHSKRRKRTPDFKGMPNLEYLFLEECTSLEEVHHSLGCSRKLIELNLYECESLERFPYANVESLESLNLENCHSLEKFPEILGIMKPELEISIFNSRIWELPLSINHLQPHLTELDLSYMKKLVSLPRSISNFKGLVRLNVSNSAKLESLPEEIGDLENLESLDARDTLISQPPSSIIRLNKLKSLSFAKQKTGEGRVFFVFPHVNEGLRSLEDLDLRYCNLIDGGLPEDIGSLSSLKELYLKGNNFEHLPQSLAQLGSLRSLDLSECSRLKEFLGVNMAEGLRSLEDLDFSYCNLIDGGLPEDIGCLSSLKKLYLKGNNFEHLPRSIAQLGSLQTFDLSECSRLKEFIGVNVAEGLCSLENLNLSYCNIIDGGLPEDIGCLSSLKELNL